MILWLVLLWLSSAQAAAASELLVDWSAPPECPAQDEVVSHVERALGEGAKVNLTAIVRVTRFAGGYRAQLNLTSSAGFGDRELEDSRCEVLAESVALVIALSASRSTVEHGELAPDAQDSGLTIALSPLVSASAGPLPKVALGAGLTFALEGLASLRLELGATYHAKQSSTFDGSALDDGITAGGRFDLLRFGARVCRLWALGATELGPCLGAQLHRIAGKGFGGMRSSPGHSLAWGPALGAFGRLRLWPHFALSLALDAALPLSRQRFVFSDAGLLHRPSALWFQLSVGPEVLF
ncbi:MAG TPA: hypothetical protein VJR89_10705 [Polyangiales bacterium]|nr:hypothetical protein [Polyangiales bacterium]